MYKDFIAGWAAGGTGLVIGHPLDTVKARLQTIAGYRGIFDCLGRTFKEESLFGLYKGLWVPFLFAGAMNSLLFAGYGLGLKILHPGESNIQARKDLPMREILLASICGTMAQLGPAIPVELIKTKLQVQRESYAAGSTRTIYRGPFDCVRKILKTEGFRGLFKGGSVLFFRDNIGYLFYIPLYEGGLRVLRAREVNETFAMMFCGGVAGLVGWWVITPLEVVKNQIQADKSGNSKRFWAVTATVWQEGGYRSFYRGGLTLALRGFIVNSAVFLVYENILRLLEVP